MKMEVVVVFEEEMWEEVVAEQLVDLKYHCRIVQKSGKKS